MLTTHKKDAFLLKARDATQCLSIFTTLVLPIPTWLLKKEKKIIGQTNKVKFLLLELKSIITKTNKHCIDTHKININSQYNLLDVIYLHYNDKELIFSYDHNIHFFILIDFKFTNSIFPTNN